METPVHVFTVENSNIFVRLLEYIFTKDYKYRFMDFKSGEECIDHLRLEPDIIILEDNLPGMNGFDTLQKIKRNKPDTIVILLLNNDNDKQPSTFLDSGADDFLLKDDLVIEKVIEKLESFFVIADVSHLPGSKRKKKPSLKELQFSD